LLDGLMRQDGTCASLPPLDLRCCLIGCEHLPVKQFQPEYTLGWLRAAAEPHMRRCRRLPKCIFCRFKDDSVIAGLHKLDKGCQMLCGVCVKGAGGDWPGRRKMWEELPGCFELPAW
ncbi:hypothetical protein B0H14DRAFT_2191774, partial [Mycena olivaceomarginata]